MGESEWRLTATAITLLALALTGFQLARAIWLGRPVRVRRYRSILLVEFAAGPLLSWPAGHRDERVVPSTVVASAFETQPYGAASVTSYRPHGERLLVAGTGQPGPDCGIWAVVEDARSGVFWLQGPATVRGSAWELDVVLGTGEPAHAGLRYRLSLAVVAPPLHETWHGMARQTNAIRLAERPLAASWLDRDRTFELRTSAEAFTIVEARNADRPF
jgi:hypothetical protein